MSLFQVQVLVLRDVVLWNVPDCCFSGGIYPLHGFWSVVSFPMNCAQDELLRVVEELESKVAPVWECV